MSNPWFSVCLRNPGHWDIDGEGGRHFRIRGRPGDVLVNDERDGEEFGGRSRPWLHFPTVEAAMTWIVFQYLRLDAAPVDGESKP